MVLMCFSRTAIRRSSSWLSGVSPITRSYALPPPSHVVQVIGVEHATSRLAAHPCLSLQGKALDPVRARRHQALPLEFPNQRPNDFDTMIGRESRGGGDVLHQFHVGAGKRNAFQA